MTGRAFILGDANVTCHGVLVSLKSVDIPSIIISNDRHGSCIHSKNVAFKLFPNPLYNPDKYVKNLIGLVERGKKDILIPTSDSTVELVSKNKELLQDYFYIPIPDWSVIKKCLYKEDTYKIAKELDICIPEVYKAKNLNALKQISKNIRYPCIIKPSSHIMNKYFEKKVIVIKSRKNLVDIYNKFLKCELYPLIQENIPGPPTSLYSMCSALDFDNNPIGIFTGRKIRQIPYDHGVCTISESVWVPELFKIGYKLLKEIKYVGISQIEFKLDPRDEEYKLLEINPRPWYWISLATICGVNLPYLLVRMFEGDHPSPSIFREGVKWHYLSSDIALLGTQIFKKNPLFAYSDFIKSCMGPRTFAILSLNDLNPFRQEIKNLIFEFIEKSNVIKGTSHDSDSIMV